MDNIFTRKKARIVEFKQKRNENKLEYQPKEFPDNVFKSCNRCNNTIPYEELMENMYVCPRCGNHMKISASERIRQLVDMNTFEEYDRYIESDNKDNFVGYSEKLEKYKRATGMHEAVICGIGEIDGYKTAICVMDSNFMMGSMGAVVGEKITRMIETAAKEKLPLLISCTSGGARMQEGIVSLMQMVKTSAALKRFSDDGGLYITLLTNPTTGGVSASFAMLGDIIIAEPDALVGFAGKRVIEKTIGEVLPAEFQHAEFLLKKGFIDMIIERKELKKTISSLVMMHGGKKS